MPPTRAHDDLRLAYTELHLHSPGRYTFESSLQQLELFSQVRYYTIVIWDSYSHRRPCQRFAKTSAPYSIRILYAYMQHWFCFGIGYSPTFHHCNSTPKNPARRKISEISFTKPSYSRFCLKFCCHGNRGHSGENHTIEPKISTLSCVHPELTDWIIFKFSHRRHGEISTFETINVRKLSF